MKDQLISIIFESLFFLIILAFAIVFIFVFNKRRVKTLSPLLKEFGAKALYFPFLALKGKYNDVNFKISFIPASRHSPSYLNIYFYRKISFSLTIRKDSSLVRFGKKFGFVHDIKTRDPEFDREFVVESRNKGTVLSILTRPEVKQAIRDIFGAGFTVLKARKEFFINKPNYRFKEDVTADKIRFILERLFIIARGY